jgi:hypothetical protein
MHHDIDPHMQPVTHRAAAGEQHRPNRQHHEDALAPGKAGVEHVAQRHLHRADGEGRQRQEKDRRGLDDGKRTLNGPVEVLHGFDLNVAAAGGVARGVVDRHNRPQSRGNPSTRKHPGDASDGQRPKTQLKRPS